MGEIAILHARESRDFACAMAAALAVEGHCVRRSEAGAPAAGDQARADAVIVVWSRDAIASAPTVDEARRALARRVLVPVAVGGVDPPASFAHLWPIDLAGWSGDRDDPRWEFVRDEISLALRRNEFAPEPQAKEASGLGLPTLPGASARAAIPLMAGFAAAGVAAAVVAIFLSSRAGESRPAAPAPQNLPRAVVVGVEGMEDEFSAAPPARVLDGAAPPERFAAAEAAETEGDADNAPGPEQDLATMAAALAAEEASPDETPAEEAGDDPAPAEAPAMAAAAGEEDAASEESAAPVETGALAVEDVPPEAAPALPPPAPDNFAGPVFRDCYDCPDMAGVPAGSMPGDGVVQTVGALTIIRSFALSRREITFDQWRACVDDGGCRAYEPADAGWGRGKRPVINVSYEDAQSYVDWLTQKTGRRYRLPSEAEWEYAARAGASGPFSFGEPTPAKANYDGGPGARRAMTAPAGSFAPSVYGLYDMHGNVAEWVSDCAVEDGAEAGAGDCASRIVKGGAWDAPPAGIAAGARQEAPESTRADDLGFRVARDLP